MLLKVLYLFTKCLILSFVKISREVPGQVKYQLSPWPVTRVYKVSSELFKKVFSPLHFVPQPRTHSYSLTRMKQILWEGRLWLPKKAKKSPSLYQLHDPHPLRLNQKDLQSRICLLVDNNHKQRVLRYVQYPKNTTKTGRAQIKRYVRQYINFWRQLLTIRVAWLCLSNQKGTLMWPHSWVFGRPKIGQVE